MKLIPSSLLLFNKKKDTWLWPSCKNPKTLSFRAGTGSNNTMFKTVNSVFFDPKYALHIEPEVEVTTPDSCFTNSSESASISTEFEEWLNMNEYSSVETIVRGARSERLFFEPGPNTSSILEVNKQCMDLKVGGSGGGDADVPYKESVAMSIESNDPQGDFKKSMEEMVENHGLKDWESLEELLGWYLRMNGQNHHEFIVGAFIDLLAEISSSGVGKGVDGGTHKGANSSSDHSTASFTSVASSFTSSVCSPLSKGGGEKEIQKEKLKKIIINK
ncbi:transcription repressor OFP13-like [Bidens hawaiensis]|uniref:transcription repressor OFP13-like n=1 Tax=Bidens hawaiensis TaxID=980011 RepID=UPI00404963A1